MKHLVTGDECLYGTKQTPKRWKSCCNDFEYRTAECLYDVRYEWYTRRRHWGIRLSDTVGGGYIKIDFCPHCGAKLQPIKKHG